MVNADSDYADYWLQRMGDRTIKQYSLTQSDDVSVWADDVCLDDYGCATFNLHSTIGGHKQSILVQLGVPGVHNVNNALAAATVCLNVGASLTDIALGLRQLAPVAGRVNLIKVKEGLTLIDDSYNANVESVKAAADLLARTPGKKILVLGDMAELGQNARGYHEEVGQYAKDCGIDHLYTLGVLSQSASETFNGNGKHFSSRLQLLSHLYKKLDACSQKVTVLVKGSRSAQMERVVEALVGQYDADHDDEDLEVGQC